MTVLLEGNYLHEILRQEAPRAASREVVVIASGNGVALGEVLGKILKACPATGTASTAPANTGDGTMTAVAMGSETEIGTYLAVCTAAAVGAGTFAVYTPGGLRLKDAEVGVAYDEQHLAFTLNAGGTDFIVGDSFTVAVAEGSGKAVPIDFTAVDGSQTAYGFTIAGYDATAADVEGVAIVRDAVIVPDNLVWPDGATAEQKASALAWLSVQQHLISREGI